MSNTQLAQSNTNAVIGNFTQAELDTLKATVAVGASNEQFALFVQTCVSAQLNPFLNQIYCIVYGGKMSIQVSVEGVLALARRIDGYKGVDVELVHENDDFKYNAATKEISHNVGFPRGRVVGGYAIARREGFQDVVTLMEKDEVDHMTRGNNKTMWSNYFNDMFKKHIVKRAAKLQFGIELSEDELIGSDTPAYDPNARVDITPAQPVITTETGAINAEETAEHLWKEIAHVVEANGLEKSVVTQLIKKHFDGKKDLSPQQLMALKKFVEAEANNVVEPEEQDEFSFDIEE